MKISTRQAHVLANLERVIPRPYKIAVTSPVRRFQLDGRDCTAQITGLVVKRLVTANVGTFERCPKFRDPVSPRPVPLS